MAGMKRTEQQNAALHLYLRWLSESLNDAGYTVLKVLRHDAEIPWTETLAKEHLWRPIQEAMTKHHSTTECSKLDYPAIEQVLSRHLSEKLGITPPPWPSQETLALQDQSDMAAR